MSEQTPQVEIEATTPPPNRANSAQLKAINTTEGPVLITAGPGTGKTFTLVQRTIHLIKDLGVKPEEIFVATFTEKAAKELVTRITNELDEQNIAANINDMYVGTFHSLCLRIIKDNLEYSHLKKNYRLLDQFDQNYQIYQNFHRFKQIEDFEVLFPTDSRQGQWSKCLTISSWVNNLSEELVEPERLAHDKEVEIVVLGRVFAEYRKMLDEENLLDFSSIQVETLRLLTESPQVLDKYTSQLRYLMIDEYQDTNYIQEQLVFLLAQRRHNICVVGDDDQGLYRFRGATIRNILEFPQKFDATTPCAVIPLTENYRSDKDIVDFYNRWMVTTSGAKFSFTWDRGGQEFRYHKSIQAAQPKEISSPAVIKLLGDSEEEWHKNVLSFIKQMKDSGTLKDYNQLAFLFSSVKNDRATKLAAFLDENGINIYSPRSDMFFQRREIMLALGCLLIMFPTYFRKLEDPNDDDCKYLSEKYRNYLLTCVKETSTMLEEQSDAELLIFLRDRGRAHSVLKANTDYAFAALFYQLLQFQPFKSWCAEDMSSGVVDLRPTRNLAQLSQLLGKYEYLHGVTVLSAEERNGKRGIDHDSERLFNLFLRLQFDGGIGEYEDDSEYAPSGCVSFLTIHQSKGMEFPVVFVDSLGNHNGPRQQRGDDVLDSVAAKYFQRPSFEPADLIKYFDFWRKYYTAFSRAQNLLVLTAPSPLHPIFRDLTDSLPSIDDPTFDISQFALADVKDVNLKEEFSFTSHISVYETCSLQYKFFRDLAFSPVRVSAMLFGTLVHETIEDVHKAALRGEETLITTENVEKWFDTNYNQLSHTEHAYLAPAQLKSALKQVQNYIKRQGGDWSHIKQAEVDVSLVKPDYILEGTIDLIQGVDNTVEIVDFKTAKKPDVNTADGYERWQLEQYHRQLHIYAHLVEQNTGQKVSKMHLYYTSTEDGNPLITYPYQQTAVDATIQVFDQTAHNILNKKYDTLSRSQHTCDNCDFRHFCGRAN